MRPWRVPAPSWAWARVWIWVGLLTHLGMYRVPCGWWHEGGGKWGKSWATNKIKEMSALGKYPTRVIRYAKGLGNRVPFFLLRMHNNGMV